MLSNNSRTAVATNKRSANESVVEANMTLQQAKSIARHLGLTLRQLRSGRYRVNFRDGTEGTAHYTDSLENAVEAAIEMAKKRTP